MFFLKDQKTRVKEEKDKILDLLKNIENHRKLAEYIRKLCNSPGKEEFKRDFVDAIVSMDEKDRLSVIQFLNESGVSAKSPLIQMLKIDQIDLEHKGFFKSDYKFNEHKDRVRNYKDPQELAKDNSRYAQLYRFLERGKNAPALESAAFKQNPPLGARNK